MSRSASGGVSGEVDEGGENGRLPRPARLVRDVGRGVVRGLLVPGSSVEDDLDTRERTCHSPAQVAVLLLWSTEKYSEYSI